jgi:hypothetical protein
MANDKVFMSRCLELGRIAFDGDAPVGSVILFEEGIRQK